MFHISSSNNNVSEPVKSKIDAAIAAKDDPDFKWTVRDARNGKERVLSERELLLIRRIQTGQCVCVW